MCIVKDVMKPFEIQEPTTDHETDSGYETQDFFDKLFKRPKKLKKKRVKKSREIQVPKDTLKKTYSDNENSDTPLKEVLKKKFNDIRKFTKDMFKEKSDMLDDARDPLSEDASFDDEVKLKRAISKQLSLQKKMSRKQMVKIDQK